MICVEKCHRHTNVRRFQQMTEMSAKALSRISNRFSWVNKEIRVKIRISFPKFWNFALDKYKSRTKCCMLRDIERYIFRKDPKRRSLLPYFRSKVSARWYHRWCEWTNESLDQETRSRISFNFEESAWQMTFMQIVGARNPRGYFRFRVRRPSIIDKNFEDRKEDYFQMTDRENPYCTCAHDCIFSKKRVDSWCRQCESQNTKFAIPSLMLHVRAR